MRRVSIGVITLIVLVGGAVRGQDRPQRNVVLLFVDDLHIGFASTPRLRTGLRQATERLLASGTSVGLVSDGTSSILIQPTNDSAPFLEVARRITGGGLKPSDLGNPTPAITADVARRETAAQTILQRTIAAMQPNAVLYVTERETQPSAWMPLVLTKPVDVDAGAVRLMKIGEPPSGMQIQGVVTVPR